ncbi:hypothetical protein BDK51DRAFT_25827 [Blyttiomyces helicus]|uniref:Uncharacterized protein n=1 Tax=Blyttiomyces helicus TaxID=388810 RepID=A0A4P9WP44_9FUNG|nr:hypothetical protein BDK51DRAFT_25827 [Blyttiomyces helicus]|eukprot:RKO94262.1 hypothetical protein BDK51DRAFT_25827 [Blyttiomyces helicus]
MSSIGVFNLFCKPFNSFRSIIAPPRLRSRLKRIKEAQKQTQQLSEVAAINWVDNRTAPMQRAPSSFGSSSTREKETGHDYREKKGEQSKNETKKIWTDAVRPHLQPRKVTVGNGAVGGAPRGAAPERRRRDTKTEKLRGKPKPLPGVRKKPRLQSNTKNETLEKVAPMTLHADQKSWW